MLEWGFVNPNLKSFFLPIFASIKADRIKAKRAGDKKEDLLLKLALNSSYGKMLEEFSFLYSPTAGMSVTINGQLFLSMLIERLKLELNISCIMSNTDGITILVPIEKIDDMRKVVKSWEKLTRLEMEEVEYESMFIRDVNNYIAVKKGYSETKNKKSHVKVKGFFKDSYDLGKGGHPLIVPIALINYYVDGTKIKDSIRNHDDILDFCMYQKIDKQYTVIYLDEKQQQINRYFASSKGAYLYKKRGPTKEHVKKETGVEILNKVLNRDPNNYNINYSYYEVQCSELIEKLEPRQQKLF